MPDTFHEFLTFTSDHNISVQQIQNKINIEFTTKHIPQSNDPHEVILTPTRRKPRKYYGLETCLVNFRTKSDRKSVV